MRERVGEITSVSYQNSFPPLSRNRKGRKCRKRQSPGSLKLTGEKSSLASSQLLPVCQKSLAYLGLQFHNSDFCICHHMIFSMPVWMSVCLHMAVFLKGHRSHWIKVHSTSV